MIYRIFVDNKLRAAVAHAEDAAAFVAVLGDGAEIRVNRKVVWREGSEAFSAGTSYDSAAEVIWARAGAPGGDPDVRAAQALLGERSN